PLCLPDALPIYRNPYLGNLKNQLARSGFVKFCRSGGVETIVSKLKLAVARRLLTLFTFFLFFFCMLDDAHHCGNIRVDIFTGELTSEFHIGMQVTVFE